MCGEIQPKSMQFQYLTLHLMNTKGINCMLLHIFSTFCKTSAIRWLVSSAKTGWWVCKWEQGNGAVQATCAPLGMLLGSSFWKAVMWLFGRGHREGNLLFLSAADTLSHWLCDSEHFNSYAGVIKAQTLEILVCSWICIRVMCQISLKAFVMWAGDRLSFV